MDHLQCSLQTKEEYCGIKVIIKYRNCSHSLFRAKPRSCGPPEWYQNKRARWWCQSEYTLVFLRNLKLLLNKKKTCINICIFQ